MKAKKTQKTVEKGRVYITSTFNNTIVTITDEHGNTLGWGSAGNVGFKGTRKSTPFAATSAVDQVARRVMAGSGLRSIEVFIKGPGAGRDAALRALKSAGLSISMIADVTPMPHNGVRPKKKRRI
jgi:small subunit ribosomal protein S11